MCLACIGRPKFLTTMRELNIDGEPSCRFCQTISRDLRKKWADHYCEWWALDSFSGTQSKDSSAGYEEVARMAAHSASATGSRRASSESPSHRAGSGDGSYLPQGVSYYNQQTGYGRASSVGELASRETSHHVGYDEALLSTSQSSPLPPSGSVAADQRTRPAPPTLFTFVEPSARDNPWAEAMEEDTQEERMEEGEQDEGAGSGDQAPLPTDPEDPSERVNSIFKEVFQRAYSSGVYKAQATVTPTIPMGSLSTGRGPVKSEFLPAYPPVEAWFKLTESMPNLKPHEKIKDLRGIIIPAEVEGLCHRHWKIPVAESSLQPEGFKGVKHGQYTLPPQHVHATGDKALRESWLSNLRAVNHLSCAGMIIDYLKQMSDPSDPELHGVALHGMTAGSHRDVYCHRVSSGH